MGPIYPIRDLISRGVGESSNKATQQKKGQGRVRDKNGLMEGSQIQKVFNRIPPDEPLSPAEIRTLLTDMNPGNVNACNRKLFDANLLARVDYGVYIKSGVAQS